MKNNYKIIKVYGMEFIFPLIPTYFTSCKEGKEDIFFKIFVENDYLKIVEVCNSIYSQYIKFWDVSLTKYNIEELFDRKKDGAYFILNKFVDGWEENSCKKDFYEILFNVKELINEKL